MCNRFAAAHRAPKDPAILGVVYLDDDNSVRSFIHDHGVTWPLLGYRNAEAVNAYGVSAIPVTFLIGPDGWMCRRVVSRRAACSLHRVGERPTYPIHD